ncbi:hypothetical protein ACB098_11G047600 [Castanea mollissima]
MVFSKPRFFARMIPCSIAMASVSSTAIRPNRGMHFYCHHLPFPISDYNSHRNGIAPSKFILKKPTRGGGGCPCFLISLRILYIPVPGPLEILYHLDCCLPNVILRNTISLMNNLISIVPYHPGYTKEDLHVPLSSFF